MSARKQIVERYIDGFRRMDRAQILSCVADDVVWVLHGYETLEAKDGFAGEIQNDAFTGDAISRLETYQVNLS